MDAPLQRSIESLLGPRAPAARYRTRVDNLHTLIALAAAGVGLAVVPRVAVDAATSLDVCELLDPWAHRQLTLCLGAAVQPSSEPTAALAEHVRRAVAGGA